MFLRNNKNRLVLFIIIPVVILIIAAIILITSSQVNFSAAIAGIKAKGMISIGLRIDLTGFAVKNGDSGIIEGYEADIADEIIKRLITDDIKVQIKEINSKTGKVLIKNGELDMTLAAYIKGSESYINYSAPYYTDGVVFYAKQDGIKSAEDLNGKTVGVVTSSYAGQKLEDFFKGKNISCSVKNYSSYPDTADALHAGKIDVFAGGSILMQSFAKDFIKLKGFVLPHGYCIAVSNSNEELIKAVNKILSDMKNEGAISLLEKKWQLTDYSK